MNAREFCGDRAHELFQVLAYDPDNALFLCADQSIAFGFTCTPLPGGDQTDADRLSVLINQDWPANTMLQLGLWAGPDIETTLALYQGLRIDLTDRLLNDTVENHTEFLRGSALKPVTAGSDTLTRDMIGLITVKIPCASDNPTEGEITAAAELRAVVLQITSTIGLQPQTLTNNGYVRILQTMLNWGQQAGWRQRILPECDPRRLISEQLLDYDTIIEVDKNGISLGDYRAVTLSAKRLPERIVFSNALRYLGDPMSGGRGIPQNTLITLNMVFPDTEKIRQEMTAKAQWTTNAATGPVAKFVPALAAKKRGFDVFFTSMDIGNRPLQAYLGMVLFCPKEQEQSAIGTATTYWRELGFQLLPDRYFALPLLLNLLPFGAERAAVRDSMRYRTMAANHAVALAPIMSDWKGGQTPTMNLVSRNGQLMSVSLFDSNTNYNAVIAAESGSGKSFFANELLVSNLSAGGRDFVIDVGRSYEKLCESLGGQFLCFSRDSDLCINPFPLIEDWHEEADVVAAVVSAMAAPTEPLGDLRTAGLKRTLKGLWDAHGKAMTVDMIAASLLAEDDERLQDVGNQLFAFTSAGEYGRFFAGDNNVDFRNNLVVLELEELKGRKHLQQVILLILIYQIQQVLYLGDRSTPTIVAIDEAWDLLTEGAVANFIAHAYRRFRKYMAAALTITQSLEDFYLNEAGRAIADNSATTFLLSQKNQTIDRLAKDHRLPLGDNAVPLLKSVHTVAGAYSEILVVSNYGAGIGRLLVDPFRQLLYSTRPDEVSAINRYRNQGLSVNEAIQAVLDEKRGGPNGN